MNNELNPSDSQLLIYQSSSGDIRLDVRLESETVWLSQEQIAMLFGKGRSTITEHISNVYEEGELEQNSTCRKFRQVRQEGNREVEREIDYYNLDVIISVGYRVKSHQGTQFRIWATLSCLCRGDGAAADTHVYERLDCPSRYDN